MFDKLSINHENIAMQHILFIAQKLVFNMEEYLKQHFDDIIFFRLRSTKNVRQKNANTKKTQHFFKTIPKC